MARAKSSPASSAQSSATIGFEAKLWLAADKLRNNMDAAEYKHVVLGLIFLKYISDTFGEHRAKLLAGQGDYQGGNPEDQDEYRAETVLANPPFNDSDWFRRDDDVRWQFGVPPKGNANFAWVQHFIHHLAPQGMMPTRIKIDAPNPAPESDDASFYKAWNETPKDVDFAKVLQAWRNQEIVL